MINEDMIPANRNVNIEEYSKKELSIIDAKVKLQQAQTIMQKETIVGVIGIIKDLIEVKKINDQGKIQIAIMEEQGELIRQDLESFRVKNNLTRDSFQEKAMVTKYFLEALNENLKNQTISDAIKIATIKCYESALAQLLKS